MNRPLPGPGHSLFRPERLRIALVLETSGGGSGRHVLDLAEGMTARGQSVTVIWSPVRAQADFRDRLAALPWVEMHELPFQRAVGPYDLTSLRALRALMERIGPFDVLHGHSSKAGALVRLLPRAMPGKRVYTPHAFRTMDPALGAGQRQIYATIERILAPRADRIITVSAEEHAHARSIGIAPERLATVVNGAALPERADRAAARAAMGLDPGDIAVGFIGRLDAQKDPLRFVDAVAEAARAVPRLRGVVIGDGPLRAEAETEAHGSGAPITFMGWQDGPALFPGLDIFCMTSFYEAMPYTLLEALHAGVPVVSTAVGGTAETVEEGFNGFVLPVDVPAADIAGRLAALAHDAETRARFGTAARALARDRSIDRMVDDTLDVYVAAPAGVHRLP